MMSENNDPPSQDSPEMDSGASVLGLVLFTVYLVMYVTFVLANTFAPDVMDYEIFGVNLAVLSGMTLIISAFVLAVTYAWFCRDKRSGNKEQDS